MTRKLKSKFLILVLVFFVCQGFSQEKNIIGDPDIAFKKARDLAFNNQRKRAQGTLRLILTKYPNYLDVRSFLASTYSWDGNYKQSRIEFEFILNVNPKRKRDWVAAINNELWGGYPIKGLRLIEKSMVYFPDDFDLLYLKAKAQEDMGDGDQALKTITLLLKNSPENKKLKGYKKGLIGRLSLNAVGVSYSADLFGNNARDPMQYLTLKYSRQTKYGSITGKINVNRRFQKNGIQYEVDMYPRIIKGLYAYISMGFSNTDLFPGFRVGGELFKSLPNAFEASLGFRSLKFTETTTIYTGSLGWYSGNSYWVFRTYITPNEVGGSKSGRLTYRKYRSDADNYFYVSVGFGFSPEIDRFPINENEQVIFDLKSQKIALGYYFTTSNKKNAWGTSFSLSHEEKSYSRNDYFLVYSLGLSYRVKFK